MMSDTATMPPVHPGEILLEEYLKPVGLSQHRLALCLGVDPRRINEIVQGKRSITADTALRLARFFGTSPQMWLNLQSWFDLEQAQDALGSQRGLDVEGHGPIRVIRVKERHAPTPRRPVGRIAETRLEGRRVA